MKCVITGSSGFIGGALKQRLLEMGWEVYETMRPDVDYVFLFGSPSSDHWFKYAQSYSLRETIENFLNAADFCKEHKIKLIYPTSGTVNEGTTPYSKCKQIIEVLASMYPNTLGVKIYAGYGVGEGHKGEYASIVYKFTKEMMNGKRPQIWGDGNQTRDFIYISDIIDNILYQLDDTDPKYKDLFVYGTPGIIEIGTGTSYSLNQVVKIINQQLGTNIEPEYIEKPQQYIENTICTNPCECKVSLEEGIKRIINE